MFSGLYGDLPQAKDETENGKKDAETPGGNWSGSTLLIPPPKRATTTAFAPPSVSALRKPRSSIVNPPPPPPTTASTTPRENKKTAPPPPPSITESAAASLFGGDHNIIEEYDPARPNDYDAILKQREQQRLEAEAEADRQERLREIREVEAMEERRLLQRVQGEERQREGTHSKQQVAWKQQQDDDEGEEDNLHSFTGGGLGGMAQHEETLLRGGVGVGVGPSSTPSSSRQQQQQQQQAPKGMTLAQKMLESMGWKEGQGLGKSGQGIATPLAVQKTDARSGRVVALAPRSAARTAVVVGTHPHTSSKKNRIEKHCESQHPISKVVLLRNVVPPGAVDASLDEEIGVECSKHGRVLNVMVFEVTEPPGFPDEEAVRVFVQFEECAGAAAALQDLGGRFFGGRVVRASYFDEERFEKGDLAPRLDEI